jgi:hypothetical protein
VGGTCTLTVNVRVVAATHRDLAKCSVSEMMTRLQGMSYNPPDEGHRLCERPQQPDASLVGIDFRVQDGQLYGVGDGGGIYTIDTTNAKATLVSSLTVALDPLATSFGVDFNPAAESTR